MDSRQRPAIHFSLFKEESPHGPDPTATRSPASWSCCPQPQQQMEARHGRCCATTYRSLRLHAARHARHRDRPTSCSPRAAARRKSRSTASPRATADLALRFDLTVPLAKYVALHYNELDVPLPPLPDRQGLPRRARAARPLPRVLSGGYRHHRRRQARHHATRPRSPSIIYTHVHRAGPQALPASA